MSSLLALLLVLQLAVAATPLPQLFDQALSASRSGDFAGALPLWNQVLELAPNDAAAWSNRGNVQLALGDPQAAIADQTHAMELDPTSPDPHLNRGTAEEALQRWAEAEADYRWILDRDAGAGRPLDASALYNLGNVQGSLGQWDQARSSFVAAARWGSTPWPPDSGKTPPPWKLWWSRFCCSRVYCSAPPAAA